MSFIFKRIQKEDYIQQHYQDSIRKLRGEPLFVAGMDKMVLQNTRNGWGDVIINQHGEVE